MLKMLQSINILHNFILPFIQVNCIILLGWSFNQTHRQDFASGIFIGKS